MSDSCRRPKIISNLALIAALLFALPPRIVADTSQVPQRVLTTAAEVRALSEGEARSGLSIRISGIFIGEADPEGIAFVVQDATDAIYVQGPPELVTGLHRGNLVEIEGVSNPGGFAPYVIAQKIRKVGQGHIPDPIRVSLDDLNAGRMDAKWIEISGIVRSAEAKTLGDAAPPPPGTRYQGHTNPQSKRVKLKLASGDSRLVMEMDAGTNLADLVDAEVRVRGICFNLHNRNRQFVRPFVQVPRGVVITIEKPPSATPFSGEPVSIASLLQFDQLTAAHGHRVHVRGVVLHHSPGEALWIREQGRSLRVDTAQQGILQPGDEVDVLGFPTVRNYSAVLEDAMFQKSGPQTSPTLPAQPEPHTLADVSDALSRDADLVSMEARLEKVLHFADHAALILDWHGVSVRARMPLPTGADIPSDWSPGSIARVSGICSVLTGDAGPLGGLWEPRAFQLLLRSPADFEVTRPPPFWNADRAVWLLLGFLALALATVPIILLVARQRLKKQERRREMAEAEFSAILNERNRVAREIHDTLSQNLGAICMQLENARHHAGEISAPARKNLASALGLARTAMSDARDSIWNMRSQILEKCDLGEALNIILVRMTENTDVKANLHVQGSRRRLPPVVENNLLRIGQEAITNACKHANPSRIDVRLAFEGRMVRLDVKDDGAGFSVETSPQPEHGHFGLVGIKERAELLGGNATIKSAPGQGTLVVANVPV